MPWELILSPSDSRESLGSVTHVQDLLKTAIPEIELFQDASGDEKIAAMELSGMEVPDVIREMWAGKKGSYQGLYAGPEFTVEFHFDGDEDAVRSVSLDVRGGGNPTPVINRISSIPGWQIRDMNGVAPSADSGVNFSDGGDDAIQGVKSEE